MEIEEMIESMIVRLNSVKASLMAAKVLYQIGKPDLAYRMINETKIILKGMAKNGQEQLSVD